MSYFLLNIGPIFKSLGSKNVFLKTGPIGCPETSAINYHHSLREAQKSAVLFIKLNYNSSSVQIG